MTTDGKFNLCGIFEALFAQEMPLHHPQMFILTRFEFPKGPHEIKMVLMQEDRVLAHIAFNRASEKDEPQNHIWGVYNLTAENFNPIELKIFDSGTLIAERTLPIYRLPKPFKPNS